MKKITPLLTLLFVFFIGISAYSKTIVKPSYEFKSCGIYDVVKIELSKKATYLTIHVDFVPHWWVNFESTEVIRDSDTGTEYKIKGIKGAEMDQLLWMPNSGDSTVVLVFPALPKSVKRIDYHNNIYGISLDPEKARGEKPSELKPEIETWIDSELAKNQSEPLSDFESDNFFCNKPSRLIGCIKGYDPKAGFSTGIMYASNELTRDDFPVVAQIQPDGRFEVEFPIFNPKCSRIMFNDQWMISFYIEPGQTLAMIIDWNEILEADRRRNIRYEFKNCEFKGELAPLNYELLSFKHQDSDYRSLQEKRSTMLPLDFKAKQEKVFELNMENLDKYLKENSISSKALSLFRNSIIMDHATFLFDFVMNRDYYAQQDTSNLILQTPVPDSYYNFLQLLDLNDKGLLVVENFSSFINRFEYCDIFKKAHAIASMNHPMPEMKPEKSAYDFFVEERVEMTDKERELAKLWGKESYEPEEMAYLKENEELMVAFNEKNKDLIQKWVYYYWAPLHKKANESREIEIWKAKDLILTYDLGLVPNLVYEIAKIRSLKFRFRTSETRLSAQNHWDFLKQGISNPFLVETGEKMLAESFPAEKTISKPLAEGVGADVFRKLIEPHKGKMLFIDFWATTCGPCLSGIKSMRGIRERYADNPDFDFVFITDERGSPEKQYNDFVKEQGLINVYRIPKDDFNFLRELFRFNGIPRYVVIDKNGDVINDDFNIYSFEVELAKLVPQSKE
jgi:thiol-disulfide isomerase/thioredoxin